MTDTIKGASIAKTWQTPALVSLDSGLDGVQAQLSAGTDGMGGSETSGVV